MNANFCPAVQCCAVRTDLGMEIWNLADRVVVADMARAFWIDGLLVRT